MGAEFRFIPPGYRPPRTADGHPQPQIDLPYRLAKERLARNSALWDAGQHPDQPVEEACTYEEWHGGVASREYYRPDWDPDTATAIALYENVSEGTPEESVPEFASEEEALDWMEENWGGSREANQARLLADLAVSVHGSRVREIFARAMEACPEEVSRKIAYMIRDQDERVLQLDATAIAAALENADDEKRLDMIRLLRMIDPARFRYSQDREAPPKRPRTR